MRTLKNSTIKDVEKNRGRFELESGDMCLKPSSLIKVTTALTVPTTFEAKCTQILSR